MATEPTATTICAVATPPGQGALGIVRLSGPRSLDLLRQVCRLRRVVPRRLQAVRLVHPTTAEVVDHALVCFMPGPGSYTGEDVVEVHGHGGSLNIGRIQSIFLELGARQAAPGEFTRRAFLNGRLDLTQAEAVAEVVAARSERALRNAQATLAGALGQRLSRMRGEVVELAGLLEAAIDFADDTEGEREMELEGRHRRLSESLGRLARTHEQGRRLDGVVVALVGPVNAGKSSLFNRLLGSDRALVAAEPGTTRDYLEAETTWDGQRVILVDTAGDRPEAELSALERAGRVLAAPVLQGCDLRVQVVEVNREAPLAEVPGPVVVAANKIDLLSRAVRGRRLRELEDTGLGPVVATSAVTGEGLTELQRRVLALLFPVGGETETVQVVQQRQREGLMRAAAALEAGGQALGRGLPPEVVVEHCREALGHLDELTGERSTEAILDAVFERFCVGK